MDRACGVFGRAADVGDWERAGVHAGRPGGDGRSEWFVEHRPRRRWCPAARQGARGRRCLVVAWARCAGARGLDLGRATWPRKASPAGTRALAVVFAGRREACARSGGYVWIVRVADGSERRLVPGGAPAWSPNGRQIAYIAAGGAVEVIAVHGGRPHKVGSVRGTALDWQAIPTSAKRACRPPRGATVLASNREAVVFSRGGLVFYGCLKSLGRTQLLLNGETGYAQAHDAVIAVRLAGRFAAIATEDGKPPDFSDGVALMTSAAARRHTWPTSPSNPGRLSPPTGLLGPGLERVRGLARDHDPDGSTANRRVLPISIRVRRWRRGGQHPQLDQPHRRAIRMEHRRSVVK